MTTLAVDDELYGMVHVAAKAEGKTVDEFVSKLPREVLLLPRMRQTVRNGLPVMVCDGPVQTILPDGLSSIGGPCGFTD